MRIEFENFKNKGHSYTMFFMVFLLLFNISYSAATNQSINSSNNTTLTKSAVPAKTAKEKPKVKKTEQPREKIVTIENFLLITDPETLDKIPEIKITYLLPDGNQKILEGSTIKEWISIDNDGNRYLSELEISGYVDEYVSSLAKEVNTAGKERIFTSTLRGDIKVKGGSYGWRIDQKHEKIMLIGEIFNQINASREPIYYTREFDKNGGIGDTYVEIDLSNQHVYYYINGVLFMDTPCVSGTMTKKRATPGGVFTLYYKEPNRVLRGKKQPDGTYEYEAPVSYWMPFNGGVGLHDANWRSRFGGKIYVNAGSHGCINLPPKKAAVMYGAINVGIPVVVFY
ncbi:MAG: L,D-transpeptidase/peptidoglycan binding protein [Fusobacteriaceae bacterium]|nr:L,D-transpeptidase/peptidoglycan binding protein [Fusobacteriaceae bacterium]